MSARPLAFEPIEQTGFVHHPQPGDRNRGDSARFAIPNGTPTWPCSLPRGPSAHQATAAVCGPMRLTQDPCLPTKKKQIKHHASATIPQPARIPPTKKGETKKHPKKKKQTTKKKKKKTHPPPQTK